MRLKTPPNLKTAGFSLWIHEREFPEAEDAYTADWLVVSANLDTGNGRSWVDNSSSLQSQELASFIASAKAADWTAKEMLVESKFLEREIAWAFTKDKRYPHLIIFRAQVNANLHESHIGWFKISFDEAHRFLEQLSEILVLYPNLQAKESL